MKTRDIIIHVANIQDSHLRHQETIRILRHSVKILHGSELEKFVEMVGHASLYPTDFPQFKKPTGTDCNVPLKLHN